MRTETDTKEKILNDMINKCLILLVDGNGKLSKDTISNFQKVVDAQTEYNK